MLQVWPLDLDFRQNSVLEIPNPSLQPGQCCELEAPNLALVPAVGHWQQYIQEMGICCLKISFSWEWERCRKAWKYGVDATKCSETRNNFKKTPSFFRPVKVLYKA